MKVGIVLSTATVPPITESGLLCREAREPGRDLRQERCLRPVGAEILDEHGDAASALGSDFAIRHRPNRSASRLFGYVEPDQQVSRLVDARTPKRGGGQSDARRESVDEVSVHDPTASRSRLAPGIANDLFDECSGSPLEAGRDIGQVGSVEGATKMLPEDARAGCVVRQWNPDVPVKAPGPQDGRVDLAREIGRPEDDHAFAPTRSVQAFEKAVDHLATVLLVVAAKCLPVSESVDLIEEVDSRK